MPQDYESVDLGNGYKLAFSRSYDSLPIVESELSEQAVCLNKNIHSKSLNRRLYPLINTYDYSECPLIDLKGGMKFDPWFKFIDYMDEKILFE